MKGTDVIMTAHKQTHGSKTFYLRAAIVLTIALCASLALSVGAQPNDETQPSPHAVSEMKTTPSDDSQSRTGQDVQAQPKIVTNTAPKAEADLSSAGQSQPAPKETSTTAIVHPASYVWTCGADYGGIAPVDGSLSEWAPHYYVAHSYGPYGEVILGLEPGDTVTVNGVLVTVEGAVVMGQQCAYEDVMERVGWDATVFQTRVPDSDDCRFVYARGASSTAAAAAEARQWAGRSTGQVAGRSEDRDTNGVVSREAAPAPGGQAPTPAEAAPAPGDPAPAPAPAVPAPA